MRRKVGISIILFFFLILCGCASTPDSVETDSSDDDTWSSDRSGLDIQAEEPNSVETTEESGDTEDTAGEAARNGPDTSDTDSIATHETEQLNTLFNNDRLIERLSPSEYRQYNSTRTTYRAAIPVGWYINESETDEGSVTEIRHQAARIRVRTYSQPREDRHYYRTKVQSSIEKKDATCHPVITDRQIRMYNGLDADFMVYEYTRNRERRLRRTLVLQTDALAYIISCEAPTRSFYTHEAAFNTFMRTFQPARQN